jgi:hypothetical protein
MILETLIKEMSVTQGNMRGGLHGVLVLQFLVLTISFNQQYTQDLCHKK